jgi:hypothetical protein
VKYQKDTLTEKDLQKCRELAWIVSYVAFGIAASIILFHDYFQSITLSMRIPLSMVVGFASSLGSGLSVELYFMEFRIGHKIIRRLQHKDVYIPESSSFLGEEYNDVREEVASYMLDEFGVDIDNNSHSDEHVK